MKSTRTTFPNFPFPRKAVVLAAGLGERLRPLTGAIPKPLMPVARHEALITRTLRLLESWGVAEIAVNLHWQSGPLRKYLDRWPGPARITCSYEPIILGTGGALRPLRDFLGGEPFWMANADIIAELDPSPLAAAFSSRSPLAAVWLTARRGPRTVETDSHGRVSTFRSSRSGTPGTATFCGVQLVSPRIFQYLPAPDPCSIIAAYEAGQRAGEEVLGVRARSGYWNDAGTLDRLLDVRDHLARSPQKRRAAFPARARTAIPPGGDTARSTTAGGTGPSPLPPLPDYPFRLPSRRGAIPLFRAFDWPDPALAPVLSAMGWPLAGCRVEPLGGMRGSNRTFLRLHGPGGTVAVYARHGNERAENGRYAGHASLLAGAGVPVPRILADLPPARALAMEDVGDLSLETLAARHPARALAAYERLMPIVATFHSRGTEAVAAAGTALEPPLDIVRMHWEHSLFEEFLLRRRLGLEGLPAGVARELSAVAQRLSTAPQVLIHRDLQSSNIFCLPDGDLRLIDFQGMRMGPAAYDLASLLCDAYVGILDDAARSRLLALYARQLPDSGPSCLELFPWAAVQRLVQALGAFGRLSGLGITRFAAYIPPASATLQAMAERCGLRHLAGLAGEIRREDAPARRM